MVKIMDNEEKEALEKKARSMFPEDNKLFDFCKKEYPEALNAYLEYFAEVAKTADNENPSSSELANDISRHHSDKEPVKHLKFT